MVIRRRIRNILIPLALYAVAGPVSGYFVWHAINGERGLKTRAAYERQTHKLVAEATDLLDEKKRLERRIASFRAEALDRDLLDEQARKLLGQVRADEVVVMLPEKSGQ